MWAKSLLRPPQTVPRRRAQKTVPAKPPMHEEQNKNRYFKNILIHFMRIQNELYYISDKYTLLKGTEKVF